MGSDASGGEAGLLFEAGGDDAASTGSDALDATTTLDALDALDTADAFDARDGAPPDAVADAVGVPDAVGNKDSGDALPADAGVPCGDATGKRWSTNGHCYFTGTAAPQANAKAECVSKGAHLVTITSQAEQDFVATIGGGDRWVGLESKKITDKGTDFTWITGEDASYQHWVSGDPNSGGYCAAIRGSDQGWVDRACSDSYAPICERE